MFDDNQVTNKNVLIIKRSHESIWKKTIINDRMVYDRIVRIIITTLTHIRLVYKKHV